MFCKTFTRHCEFTPYLQVVSDGDGIRLEWKEEDEKEFKNSVCLSNEDVKALIQMLQEIGPAQ